MFNIYKCECGYIIKTKELISYCLWCKKNLNNSKEFNKINRKVNYVKQKRKK